MNPDKKEMKAIPSTSTNDYQGLIPKCLNKFEIGMKTTELRVSYDAPTNQTTYTYTVTWDDVLKSEEKYKSAINEASKILHHFGLSDIKKSGEIVVEKKEGGSGEKDAKTDGTAATESVSKSSTSFSDSSVVSGGASSAASDSSTWNSSQMATSGASSEAEAAPPATMRSAVSTSAPAPKKSVRKQKQRSRAKENNSLSVSPLSSTSSSIRRRFSKFSKAARLTARSTHSVSLKSRPPSTTTDSNSTYSSASSASYCPPTAFTKTATRPPKGFVMDELKRVTAKLIVIDSPKFRGKLRVISSIETTTSTRVARVLRELVRDYQHEKELTPQQLIESGTLYFAFREDAKPKLRRIRAADVGCLVLANLAKISDSVILILDLVGFVSKGKNIPIQLDLDSEEMQ